MSRLRKTVPLAFSLLGMALAAGCQSYEPIDVISRFGPGAKLDGGQGVTFDWSSVPLRVSSDTFVPTAGMQRSIREAIEFGMRQHGYERSSEEHPDLVIAYDLTMRRTADPWTYETYREAIFGINIANTESHELVYRGAARIRLYPAAEPEERRKRLDSAVARMLEKLPPAAPRVGDADNNGDALQQ